MEPTNPCLTSTFQTSRTLVFPSLQGPIALRFLACHQAILLEWIHCGRDAPLLGRLRLISSRIQHHPYFASLAPAMRAYFLVVVEIPLWRLERISLLNHVPEF